MKPRIQTIETVMTYSEWKRIHRIRLKRKLKKFALEMFVLSIPIWFCLLMFLHWLIFGYGVK